MKNSLKDINFFQDLLVVSVLLRARGDRRRPTGDREGATRRSLGFGLTLPPPSGRLYPSSGSLRSQVPAREIRARALEEKGARDQKLVLEHTPGGTLTSFGKRARWVDPER